MSEPKDAIRRKLLEKRRTMGGEKRRRAGRRVSRRLRQKFGDLKGGGVAGYLAFDNEVDVSAFLEAMLERGRRVALPRVRNDSEMEFVDVESLDEVEEGAFGIMEPVGGAMALGRLRLFLVPGVGFDRRGNRIGMGWGYYDRLLTRRLAAESPDSPVFVGVCYDAQLTDEPIPTEAHDVEMDYVISESEFVDCT